MSIKKKLKSFLRFFKKKEIVIIKKNVTKIDELNDKVALITGGSSGIGLAIADELLNNGCKVIICGSNLDKINSIITERNNDRLKGTIFDYNKIDNYEKYINDAIMLFGRIDIFINSAGVHTPNVDFWKIDNDEFDRVVNINLKGTFFACRMIGKYMIENKIKGNIIVISSVRGSEPAISPYGISKWGINGMILGLAREFIKHGIIVNGIAPGSTATPLLGIKEGDSYYTGDNSSNRLIATFEIADLVRFLLSDASRMIVGEIIHISSGRGIFDIR